RWVASPMHRRRDYRAGTLFGDATFVQSVDTVDSNIFASNFSQAGKHWTNGDFNYDGAVDTIEFNLLARNFSQTRAAPGLRSTPSALVPEPASVNLLALSAAALGARRRREAHIAN